MAAEWPYDARQHDPLTAMRIPVVDTPYPERSYLVAFHLGDGGHRPTDDEARMLVSFLAEYKAYFYRGNWFEQQMAKEPFDIDNGAGCVVFCKWGLDDWGYRRQTWQIGSTFAPGHPRMRVGAKALTLEQVMDRAHGADDTRGGLPSARWSVWKAKHRDVFGGAR